MSDPDTHPEMAGAEEGRGWDEREIEGSRGLQGVRAGVPQAETPYHSALALDPETAAAAEARAPVPGIFARILREKQVESGGARRWGGRCLRTRGKAGWGN